VSIILGNISFCVIFFNHKIISRSLFHRYLVFLDTQYELVIGQNSAIILNMTVFNNGESAYESRLFVHFPSSFSYINTVKQNEVGSIIRNIGIDQIMLTKCFYRRNM
jgi:hypothetical protein